MSNITKIYELRTIGYDEVIRELSSIEKAFADIAKVKKNLQKQSISTTEADELIRINQELEKEKTRTEQLRLEKVKLQNEAKVLTNLKLAETNAIKAATTALQTEAGSYQDVYRQAKQLYALIKTTSPNSGTLINFNGTLLTFDQAINKYKELTAAEQAFRRQFQQDSVLVGEYTSGIVNAFKRLGLGDLVGSQVETATKKLNELNVEFNTLKEKLRELQRNGGSQTELNSLEKQLINNRKEAANLSAQITQLKTNMQGMGTIGSQVTTAISNGFNSLKDNLQSLALQYVGFFAAFRGVQSMVTENAKLSDSFADLQIRIKGTKEDVQTLFEALKRIDTRTSLADLVDIANVISKKGVAKEEIAQLTEEFDKLFIVLGKEAGDKSEATASIVKLISIFNEDKNVTADRVNEIGTALIKLTTSGVATGAFLIDFAERVGAVRGITGLTLPSILGMGAALEQLGQKVEVSGTAAVQLTTKLFTNVEKFAKSAKIPVEEFRALLADDPFEALVKTAQGLANLSDEEIARDFEEIVTAFQDVGATGVRVKTVLADIATNGKFVQEKMKAAAVSTSDLARAQESAEIKQQTFAATLDRIKKQFETLGTSKSFQSALLTISSGILLVLSNLGFFIPVFLYFIALTNTAWGASIRLTAAWLAEKTALVLTRIEMAATNVVMAYTNAGLTTYTILTLRANTATGAAAIAYRVLAAAVKFMTSAFGLALVSVGALALAFFGLAARAQEGINAVGRLAKQQQVLAEAQAEANKQTADTIAKEKVLLAIIADRTLADETRVKALTELKGIMGEYGEALTLENVLTSEGTEILKAYNEELKKRAERTALTAIAERESNKLTRLIQYQIDIEKAIKSGGSINTADFDKDFIDKYYDRQGRGASKLGKFIGEKIGIDFTYSGKDLEAFSKLVKDEIDNQTENTRAAVNAKIENELKDKKDKEIADATNNPVKISPVEIDIEKLKREIEAMDKLIETFRGKQKDLDALVKKRADLQKQLDDALGKSKEKTSVYRGAKLTGEDKDALAIIDARVRAELQAEETKYAKLQVINKDGRDEIHKATYYEELNHINQMRLIEQRGLQDKIFYFQEKSKLNKQEFEDLISGTIDEDYEKALQRKSGLNAKELQQLSTFLKEKADLQLRYLKETQAINDRQFDIEERKAKKDLEARIAFIEENQAILEANPNVSETSKAEARKTADDKILKLTQGYYIELINLAKKYSQDNLAIEDAMQKALSDLKRRFAKDDLNITKAMYEDITKAANRYEADIRAKYARLRQEVLDAPSRPAKKNVQLRQLDNKEEEALIAGEIAAAKIRLDQLKRDVQTGKATIEELNKAEDAYQASVERFYNFLRAQGANSSTLGNIKEGISGFGQALGEQLGLAGDALDLFTQTFQIAETAMDNYFQRQEQRIQKNLEFREKVLDIETKQRKNRAQSQAEADSIEKQSEQEKEKLRKDAFEKDKKLKLQQAAINLAIQLSNIAVAASANPLNPFTFGAAGIAQYLVQAAIALAAYAVNVSQIKSSTYEFGGNPDMETTRGGRVKGRPHSQGGNPFIFKGRVFEDEVDELNIIRTKNVRDNIRYTITGTHTEIASKLNELGGGVQFKPGAKLLNRFESGGALGTKLTAPSYTPSSLYNQDNSSIISAIAQLAEEQSKRIDRLEVYQVTSTVTKAQQKQVRQDEIGTL